MRTATGLIMVILAVGCRHEPGPYIVSGEVYECEVNMDFAFVVNDYARVELPLSAESCRDGSLGGAVDAQLCEGEVTVDFYTEQMCYEPDHEFEEAPVTWTRLLGCLGNQEACNADWENGAYSSWHASCDGDGDLFWGAYQWPEEIRPWKTLYGREIGVVFEIDPIAMVVTTAYLVDCDLEQLLLDEGYIHPDMAGDKCDVVAIFHDIPYTENSDRACDE